MWSFCLLFRVKILIFAIFFKLDLQWHAKEKGRQIRFLSSLKFNPFFFFFSLEIVWLKIYKGHSTTHSNERQGMREILSRWWCSADLHHFMVIPDSINICAWSHPGLAVGGVTLFMLILCFITKLFLTCIFLVHFNMSTILFTFCSNSCGCYRDKALSVSLMNSFLTATWLNPKTEMLHLKLKIG